MKFYPLSTEVSSLGISHVEDYFGLWSVLQDRFEQMLQYVSSTDLEFHVEQASQEVPAATEYEVRNSTGIINLMGTMTKRGSSMSRQGSTIRARRAIREAANDPDVSSILLVIESPGGTVSGTKDLADDVRRISQSGKRVVTYFEDIGASAAYWVGSAGTEVFANESAHIGSIGTYLSITDYSQATEQAGIKVHVIKAGEHKGDGVPGTAITDEQLADFQRVVNETNEIFIKSVAENRNMSIERVRELADGRIHLATQAKELGLIDDVRSLDQVLSELESANQQRTGLMSADTTQQPDQPATLEELKKAFPKADADFVLNQLSDSATMESAHVAYQQIMESQLEAMSLQAEEARAEVEAREAAEGNDAVSDLPQESAGATGGGIGQWEEAINQEVERLKALPSAAKKSPVQLRSEALSNVHKDNPELVKEANPNINKLYPNSKLVGLG